MKNNHFGLFTVGIVLGGLLMFVLFGFSQARNLLTGPTNTSISTPEQFPYLIALESTRVPLAGTLTPTHPTPISKPEQPSRQIPLTPAATKLVLQNTQPLQVIGYSVEGSPLEVYTLGDGEEERMVVAGIHGGDEWNTITLANELIKYVDQNPGILSDDVTLYILPNLNPDGEARAHNKYGRLNHNGVDLNRNFPINWKMDWDRSGCWNSLQTSGGTGPGSEAETQALMKFIDSHNIQALISYHSAALGVFPGGLPWDEASIQLAESIAEVTSYPFPPIDTGCTYSGTLADYAVWSGSAAVDLELTNHFDTDFDQNLQVSDVLLNFEP